MPSTMSRLPPTNRFNRNYNHYQNPAGSTSSSTLVNNEQEELEKQQKEYQATAGVHVFEVPEGAQTVPLQTTQAHHHHQQPQSQTVISQRKPSQPARDQQLLTNLINSPGKHLRPTLNHRRSVGSLSQQSTNRPEPEDMLNNTKRDLNNLSSDENNNQEDPEDEDQDETFIVDLEDGTRKMGALFDSIANSDVPSNQSIPNPDEHPHLDYSTRLARQTEPTPKPKPPFAHLRGKVDLSNKSTQETRQTSSHTWLDNIGRGDNLSENVTSRSHASSKLLSTQRVQAHNRFVYHSNKTASSSSQHLPKSVQDPSLQNPINKDGWRSGPIITAGKSPSDTDSPEDTFQPPLPQELHPTRHPINQDPVQKFLVRGSSEYHKKVTFSQILADNNSSVTSGSLLHQSRPDPGPPFDSTTDLEVGHLAAPNSHRHPPDSHDQTLQRSQADEADQTTLATPKITGYYPATPATLRPASRLVAGEDASRLEKIKNQKNQPSRARLKRVSSALEDEPTQAEHLQPSTSQATKTTYQQTFISRNGKGKEKQVKDPLTAGLPQSLGAQPSSTILDGPADTGKAKETVESYDQTIVNGNQTLGSCFQTPHPPGWFVPEASASTRQPNRPIRHPVSAMKQAHRKTVSSSRRAPQLFDQERVIFPSNTQPVENRSDDLTPRPLKRPAHRIPDFQKPSLTKELSKNTRTLDKPDDFSSPSFDGFDPHRQLHLTSTPAPPPLQSKTFNRPSTSSTASPTGPVKTLKDLAATVIEFIVDKKPIEVLATTFSINNQSNLEKKIVIQSRKQESMSKEKSQQELEELLRSSEKVENERRRIQAKLDDLQSANPSRRSSTFISSLLQTFFFLPRRNVSSVNQRHVEKRQDEGQKTVTSGKWKVVLIGFLLQSLIMWMILHLSTIRSYNRLIETSISNNPSSSPSSSWTMGMGMGMVPGSLSYMSRENLARALRAHQLAHNSAESGGRVGRAIDGVTEITRFFVDWISGFGGFFRPAHFLVPTPSPSAPFPPPPLPLPIVHTLPLNPFLSWLLDVSHLRPLFNFFHPPTSVTITTTSTPNLHLAQNSNRSLPAPLDSFNDDHTRALLDFHHQFFPFIPT